MSGVRVLEGLDLRKVQNLATALGAQLRGGDVLLLVGEMGAGKTTFTRALATGLAVTDPDRVCSPSYTICAEHPGPTPLVHVDLFRLGDAAMAPGGRAGFEALGLADDELVREDAVLAVEWGQWWDAPPVNRVEIRISRSEIGPDSRDIRVLSHGARGTAVVAGWLKNTGKVD